VNGLIQFLKALEPNDRITAAISLGDLGDSSEKVTDPLLQALDDKEVYVQMEVSFALVKLGIHNERITKTLTSLLKNKSDDIHTATLFMMAKAGTWEQEVLSGLLESLKHRNGGIRMKAAVALGGLKEQRSREEVLEALLPLLADSIEDVKSAAARSIDLLTVKDEELKN